MQEQTTKSRPMKAMDWLIVTLVASAVVIPTVSPQSVQQMNTALVALAIFGCVLMLAWMAFGDGAHSKVWSWLPPFWPWGRRLTGATSRWVIVLLLVLGTITGIITDWLSK